jgi:ATP-dependent Clp protease protease subunit
MPKPKSEFTMDRVGRVGRISIIGPIGFDYWDGMSFAAFKRKLDELGDVNIIEVEINSPGGVITDGVAMINKLREHPATVHTYNLGEAASMGSVMLLAGDRAFIPDNAMTFIHKPLNCVCGNADEMRKKAKELDKFEDALTKAYGTFFNGSEQDIHDLMATETWYTASEIADKFDNVTVIESGEQQAAATHDPLEIFGESIEETIPKKNFFGLKKTTRKNGAQPKEVAMPLTPEEKQEIVADTTASIVTALKEQGVIKEPVNETKPPAPAAVEVAFEGDKSNPEDVQNHLEKVKMAQLEAATDWNDLASIQAYHEAISGKQDRTPPASAQNVPPTVPPAKGADEYSEEQIKASVDRQLGITK